MAYWMVVRSVYSCIVTFGVNVRICRLAGVASRPFLWPGRGGDEVIAEADQ
jgi:hypothetical protein